MNYTLKVNGNFNSATIKDESGKIVVRCESTKVIRDNAVIGLYPTMTFKNGGAQSLHNQLYKTKVDAIFASVHHLLGLGWSITDTVSKEVLTQVKIEATDWKKIGFES